MKNLIAKLILMLVLLVGGTKGMAQTTLVAGDIAIIGLNTDGDDDFSFLLLKDLTAGTSLYVTDKGWNDTSGFYTITGDGIWQWSTDAALSAGTIIHIKTTNNGSIVTGSLVATPGTVSWVENNGTVLSYAGDQVFIYQGTAANPTFITGCTWNVESYSTSANWDGSCAASQTSALPDQLTNGVNAIWLYGSGPTEYDNFRYNCSVLTSGTPSALRTSINNINNWNVDLSGNAAYTLNPFPCTFSVVFLPTVTTQAASSVNATTATGNGNITALGVPTPTQYGIVWGTSANPTVALTTKTAQGTPGGTGAYTSSITGLTANTTYHVRAYATNSVGTSYGDDVTFTTLTAGTFTGATNSDWATTTNWAGGSVPGSGTDVTIPSGKTVVIGSTTTAASKNLTVNAGGSLTIQSSVAGTGSLIISGTTSGSVTVERYMVANAWQLIAPSASGQTIGAFLTSNSIIKENPGNTANKAIKDYNESTNAWNGLTYTTSSTDLLGSGKGYAVWPASSGVVRFSGTLTVGAKSVTVAKSAVDKGWNCIGNPYTSAVAINSNAGATNFITENLTLLDPSYAAIYVWEQSNNAYTIINQSSGSFYAAVGQGFFANAASGSPVGFTAAMQTHQTTVALRSVVAETPTITLQASLNGDKRTAEVKFLQQSSRGLDVGYDAGVMKTGFDIYTNLVEGNGVGFGIQCLPIEASVSYLIPVVLESTQGGSVELKGTTLDLPLGYTAYLEDRQYGVVKELTEDGLTLTLSVNAGTNSNRFYLTVGNVATGIKEVTGKLTVSTSKGEINLVGKANNAATATLIDLQGRVLKTISLNDSGLNRISTTGIHQGIYLLKIQEDGKAGYQTKVIVKD